jgi:hypothetical protein
MAIILRQRRQRAMAQGALNRDTSRAAPCGAMPGYMSCNASNKDRAATNSLRALLAVAAALAAAAQPDEGSFQDDYGARQRRNSIAIRGL